MVLAGAFSLPAAADDSTSVESIGWLVNDPDSQTSQAVLDGIDEALAAQRQRHLVGRRDLHRRLDNQHIPRPDCALGIEPCDSAEEMAFEALELGLLIHLHIQPTDSGTIEINYEMADRRGEVVRSGDLEADDERQIGVDVVAELFEQAVGIVSIESHPSGATIYVDDDPVGQTPMSEQFGVGDYRYRLELDGYESVDGTFEIRAEEPHRIETELQQRPGQLRITNAPDGAHIYIDNQHLGRADEVIDLDAGRHVAEVRAPEYDDYRRSVEIEPGQLTDLDIEMRSESSLLRDVEASDIADHRLQLDIGLEQGAQSARYPSARTVDEPRAQVFGSWIDDDGPSHADDDRRLVTPGGLRVSVNWEGERFGLGILSASMTGRSIDQRFLLTDPVDAISQEATMTRIRTLELRPMQLRTRFFYENLAPFAQAGFGVAFHSLRAETDDGDELRLRQTDAFGAVELGVRYHFDARWSVGGSYRFQANLAGGTGFEHTLGMAVGVGLHSLPLVDPKPPEQL